MRTQMYTVCYTALYTVCFTALRDVLYTVGNLGDGGVRGGAARAEGQHRDLRYGKTLFVFVVLVLVLFMFDRISITCIIIIIKAHVGRLWSRPLLRHQA